MQGIDKQLFEREILALRVAIIFRFLSWGYGILTEPFMGKSTREIVLIEILYAFCIGICILSLVYFKKKKHIRFFGILGSVLDVIIVTAMPIIWYNSVGGMSINPAYMIKSPLYMMLLWLILGYNSFAIQPVYILIALIGGSLGYLGHFLFLVFDGRTVFTPDYVAHNVGGGVNLTFVLTPLFVYIMIGIGLVIFAVKMRNTIFSAVKNELASDQLGRFFSPKVRDEILSSQGQVESDKGKLQNIVILFSDIRNFTHFCEEKSPEDVMTFLKEYHSIMVNVIFKYNGTLDKFIGDGIMATFGTPSVSDDDADNAVKAAMEMSSALKDYNQKRTIKGLPEIKIGIGIHYGPAIVGNVGTDSRLEYTVIGDTVNIASRLESATKELKREIIISEELREMIHAGIKTAFVDTISIRGRGENDEGIFIGIRCKHTKD